MSASNYNWVCFPCRFSLRHPKTARTVPKCAQCGADLYCLGYKVEVPGKLDVRGWRKLHADCRERTLASSDQDAVQRVRDLHASEKELIRMRALGPAKGRQKIICSLAQKVRAAMGFGSE